MGKVLETAERLWNGEESTQSLNPLATMLGLEPLADGVAFVSGLANMCVFDTGDGLVWVDTGAPMTAPLMTQAVRKWSDQRVSSVVYTHGHIDHVCGTGLLDAEADANGWERPRVYAHQALPARFDRYLQTLGYNGAINARQFRTPGLKWPTTYRYPDETFTDRHELTVGGLTFELRHDRGETDDHVWVWVPEHRILCTGDLFIWASPNCGNPQKVQRYPKEWAAALEKMAELGADTLLPGHGVPIVGRDRVRQALSETAELLHLVHDQTLALMNEGRRLDEIIHAVEFPAHLLERPYLRPVYDEPAFIVRNIWRLYGGWYDGNPARLKPPADSALAGELAAVAGGAVALAARARAVADTGDLATACQLAEWAWQAAPDDPETRAARSAIYRARVDAETSLMARSIYLAAADESSE